ncbi:hypothetical protein M622_16770 [Thauera terpenica 58Eu]|uniref:Uncharacterized protein n=1 Tax=Thauera terpenica 58Eu TaxID=1348657 RepID=S9ZKI6_9RHOO|nr:hypothetical protein M622_16770 [Thauera terpenica 58Eu]
MTAAAVLKHFIFMKLTRGGKKRAGAPTSLWIIGCVILCGQYDM